MNHHIKAIHDAVELDLNAGGSGFAVHGDAKRAVHEHKQRGDAKFNEAVRVLDEAAKADKEPGAHDAASIYRQVYAHKSAQRGAPP